MLLNAQQRYLHYIKVYKFSVHVHSDVLRWIPMGLFLPEEPSAYITALWWFLVMFYPTHHTLLGPEQAKIKLFCRTFADMEGDCSWVCESSTC